MINSNLRKYSVVYMMKNKICQGWGAALLLFSFLTLVSACTKEADVSFGEDGYVSVRLVTDSGVDEAEELRTLQFTHNEQTGKPSFRFTSDSQTPGKRKVWTTITKKGATEGAPRVTIFSQRLDWDIDPTGRKLSYNGELKILSQDYKNATDLMLHAVTGETDFTKDDTQPQLQEYKRGEEHKDVELEVPYVMTTAVHKLDKSNGTLVVTDQSKALFKPKGVLTVFTIQNDLDIPVWGFYLFVETSRYQKKFSFDRMGAAQQGEAEAAVKASRMGLQGLMMSHTNRFDMVVGPQATKKYMAWLPLEDVRAIQRVRLVGEVTEGIFTRQSGDLAEGKYVHYLCHYREVDSPSYVKGRFAVDNFGNILLHHTSEYRYLFSEPEVRKHNVRDLGDFLLYYVMPYPNLYPDHPDQYTWEVADDHANPNSFNRFVEGGEVLRHTAKWSYDKQDPSGRPTYYSMRFINLPEYRVFQRHRVYLQDAFPHAQFNNVSSGYLEVSFLPYDDEAAASGAAITSAYWEEHKQDVWSVYFRGMGGNLYSGPSPHSEEHRPISIVRNTGNQIATVFNVYHPGVGQNAIIGDDKGDGRDYSRYGNVYVLPRLKR